MVVTLTTFRGSRIYSAMRNVIAAVAMFFLPLPHLLAEAPQADSRAAPAPAAAPELISVDFSNEKVRDILRTVADMFELNLVMPEDLTGRTSVKLRDVTWRQIFRETLTPIGFTFVEDEGIVRVVSVEQLATENHHSHRKTSVRDFPFGIALSALPYLVLVPIGIIQCVLFIAVLCDRLEARTKFVPKWLWAVMVLGGGVLPLLAYWLMHHSTLAKPTPGRTQMKQP